MNTNTLFVHEGETYSFRPGCWESEFCV